MDSIFKKTLLEALYSPGGRDWWNLNNFQHLQNRNLDGDQCENDLSSPVLNEETVELITKQAPVEPVPEQEPIEPVLEETIVQSKDQQSSLQPKVKKKQRYFERHVDVDEYEDDEIEVEIVKNFLVIHAKHEEKPGDKNFVSKKLTRKFMIPDDVETKKLKAFIEDGAVTIFGPKKEFKTKKYSLRNSELGD